MNIIPTPLRRRLSPWRSLTRDCLQSWRLSRLRASYWHRAPGAEVRYSGMRFRITDGPDFYMQVKDEFIRGIHRFESARPDPLIIDGGSNMGLSIVAFKRQYPAARIIGFEPDPAVFELLRDNLQRNRILDARLIQAGLGAAAGPVAFAGDGASGGRVSASGAQTIRLERLSDHLSEPVDFLKLNIEGLELPVLEEAAASGRLVNVREMVIEYHGWPGGEQRLSALLALLDGNGFRYLVHDFDHETGPASKPPFRSARTWPWFCLVHGRRDA
jgi:FkbM family methyltransferase